MTTIALGYKTFQEKITSVDSLKIPWKMVYSCLIVASLLMLVFYIYSVNKLTAGAFAIKNYEKQLNNLSQENMALETNVEKSGVLNNVMEQAKELGFQKTANISYIQMLDNSLAKK